ncbi:MAG: hypothetical protein RJA61_57 [Candidatus Parcubacteria bacterium]|jgi:Zn-dependent protease
MSVVVHEVSHGFAAYLLGDKTAQYQGRLTLNPLYHLDMFGSIILPLLLVLTNAGFIIGWAKPVPYNPYNLRNQRWGEAIVSFAGPLSNFIIAFVFGLVIRFGNGVLPISFLELSLVLVIMNIVLGCFNLVPIPPLDGSKILFSVLPHRFGYIRNTLEQYGLVFVLLFVFLFWGYITPVIGLIGDFFTGLSLTGLL